MKRVKGRPHYYKTNNGYLYYLKTFTTPDGKSKNLTAKNPKEWDEKRLAIIDAYNESGKSLDYKKATIKEITPKYLEYSESYKQATYIRKKHYMNKYILPRLGNITMGKLTSNTISSFYIDTEKESGAKIVKEIHTVLNSMMVWMVDEGNLADNPIPTTAVKRFNRIIREQKEIKSIENPDGENIDVEEVKMILRAVKDTNDEIVYHMAINHGLRPSECLGVDWSNIDLDKGVLHVRQATLKTSLDKLQGTRYENQYKEYTSIAPLKTSQGIRDLPLSESTKELLLKTPESERKGLVYKDSNGNPMNHSNWDKRHFKPLLVSLGIKIKHFYTLRKFFCSYNLNEERIPLAVVSKWMGHKDKDTTLKYYTKVLEGTGHDYRMGNLLDTEVNQITALAS